MRLVAACLTFALLLSGCTDSHFNQPQMQGRAAMVSDGELKRLWLLTKQEELRTVGVGGGGGRHSVDWRTDTFFHFAVEAIDPSTTKTLWKQRLRTFGDPDAKGAGPSRVIGSDVQAQLLGQEGPRVWLLIGDEPIAVDAHDGHILVDAAGLEAHNPALKGLLPSEARLYSFDEGLVFMSADARQFVVRGDGFAATAYQPTPRPSAYPAGQRLANGRIEMVPMMPIGENPTRQATLGGQWLGLYSEKEVADINEDDVGKTLRYPWSVLDEGAVARRTFWHAKKETVQKFDDKFERLADLEPVAGAPIFLKGRFVIDPASATPDQIGGKPGLLVLHSTRMDAAGRLSLARVDGELKTLWDSELPFSETDIVRHVWKWRVPGHLLAVGEKQYVDAGVTHREQWLASVDLETGAVQSRPLEGPGADD
jgi:hypothetical protein